MWSNARVREPDFASTNFTIKFPLEIFQSVSLPHGMSATTGRKDEKKDDRSEGRKTARYERKD
jgi:hypothetical protein